MRISDWSSDVCSSDLWLPRIMRDQGMAMGSSLGMLATFSLAGAVGGIAGGWIADRLGNRFTLSVSYALAAFGIMAFGQSASTAMTYMLAALVGYGTVATTLVLTAWITAWYPASMRTSAVGWALGVGRIGAIAGPTIGEIGRAHVCTPVTNAHLVCRLLL